MLVASGAFIAGWLDFPRSLDCKHIQMSLSQGLASLRDGHGRPSQHGMRKMKRNNLDGVLTVTWNGRYCVRNELTSSIVPRGTSSPPMAETETLSWASTEILLPHQAEATFSSFVQRNSVPSIHMRCMITASLRASATIALFSPRVLAILYAIPCQNLT